MEFPGIGVIQYEPPPQEWRPFMKRKLKTWMRSFGACHDKIIYRLALQDEVQQSALKVPEHDRKEIEKERMKAWDFLLLCDRPGPFITQKQFIEAWLNRMYSSADIRKKLFARLREAATIYFNMADTNKDGFVSYDEFAQGTKVLQPHKIKSLFDSVDLNGDGVISLEEFVFVVTSHHFCSGPDDRFSTFFGPITDSEDED